MKGNEKMKNIEEKILTTKEKG